ncbi:DUF6368 family protein [Kitasatospora cineracea]|uniref:DUF6368 family protein n=1 Tax=Kitasatospora cineracea TaxID=88074 RepID=UPI0034101361
MAGPVLSIELAEPVPPSALRELRALLTGLSSRCTEPRPGCYDLHLSADRLGTTAPAPPGPTTLPLPLLTDAPAGLIGFDPQRPCEDRPFDVHLMGPGVGDEDVFTAEHADQPELPDALGFRPSHAVNVSAACNDRVDHLAAALLTAAVMDVLGGVARAELRPDQLPLVTGLPGLLALFDGDGAALGTADFLRAWAARPGFRLLK